MIPPFAQNISIIETILKNKSLIGRISFMGGIVED